MALKDLVAQKAKLTEEAIEDIMSEYARFDIEEREIVFTPEASNLSNKARILVFLVAQQGWPFVLEETIDVEVSPSNMEELLGIQGGTLRPILKSLKDRNILISKSGKYSVRPSSLSAIKAELDEQRITVRPPKKRVGRKKPLDADEDDGASRNNKPVSGQKSGTSAKGSKHGGLSPGKAFDELVKEGFFDDGKTLADLQERFHQRAIIINQSSLPQYLLKATRDNQLSRERESVGGKRVWVYRTVK